MFRKLLVPTVLSLAVLGIAVDTAQAQLRVRAETRRERRMERRGVVVRTNADVFVYDAGPRTSFYFAPDAASATPDGASIRVLLPDASARIWVDGAQTRQTGPDRVFDTPALTPGNHTYTIRATWMAGDREVNQERTVTVMPGRVTVLDFGRR